MTLLRYKLSLEFCESLKTKTNNLNKPQVLVSFLRITLNETGCKG